ncbi:TolC family outer membrane protein [Roseovarius amoyensis]|uniref:TolC family outer membrane protein n=1 Tax=Roseovarius amoyensis TaxID=2211448 RepID=UPI000DBEA579|nr:TolC family outer membrane protein [Roseovarius amoyensis]
MSSRYKTRLLGIAAALFLSVAQPLTATAETLADTLVSAYNNSGLLAQNRALLRAADEDVAQVVAGLRPIINWSVDMSRQFGRRETNGVPAGFTANVATAGIGLELLLYDFGATQLRVQAARETVLATRQSLRAIEQQVLLRAVAAFMNVRRTAELVSVRQNNLRLLREELRATRDRFEVGEVTRTDVALAEAQLASAQAGLAAAQGDRRQAVEEFRNAVGRDPGALSPPTRLPQLSGDIDGAKGLAVRKHPDILMAQHYVSAADMAVRAAEADIKPKVKFTTSLSAGDEILGGDYDRQGSVGVSVSGPIYQGGRLSSLVRKAMAQRDQQRAGLHLTRLQVEQDVGNAYADLLAAQASRKARLEEVRAARVAFEGLREEAKLGARTTLDVLDAEQDLLDAQAGLIDAETALYVAAYTVLETIGELTASDLRLNVQIYDPAAYYNLVKDAPVPISPQGQKLDRVLRALGKE